MKKIHRWQISTWKRLSDVQIISQQGNTKPQWNSTAHLSEWLKWKIGIIPNAGKDVGHS